MKTRKHRAAPQRGTHIFGALMNLASKIPDYMHDEEMAEDAQQNNATQNNLTRQFNATEAAISRDWSERMANTSWQRGVSDMKAAGINPMAAFHAGGATTPGAAQASASGGGTSASGGRTNTNFAADLQSASQVAVNDALEQRTRAEADKVRAEEQEIIARTPTHAVNIEKTRQDIAESIERIEDIRQRVLTGQTTATNIAQQTENLKATIPQIAATVDQLRALTKQAGALTGKTIAETKEIQQRVGAQLPQLEAAIKDLQRQASQLDMPRREQESAQHERFQGAFGALLRILNPLNNFLR